MSDNCSPQNISEDAGSVPTALIVGYALTGLWIAFLLFYGCFIATKPILRLDPNELGDFAAGAAAPLAFLWLVVAVFLQKEELSLQRKELELSRVALRDQANEMGKLVKETGASVAVALQAAERETRRAENARAQSLIQSLSEQIRVTSQYISCLDGHLSFYPLGRVDRQMSIDDVFDRMSESLIEWRRRRDRLELSGDGLVGRERLDRIGRLFDEVITLVDAMPSAEANHRARTLEIHGVYEVFKMFEKWYVGKLR